MFLVVIRSFAEAIGIPMLRPGSMLDAEYLIWLRHWHQCLGRIHLQSRVVPELWVPLAPF